MEGIRAKGQKKGKVGDGDEDAAESAAVKGAEMEEFKADIKKDIQDMKYAQEQDIHRMDSAIHDYKVAMETKMETIEEKMAGPCAGYGECELGGDAKD